MPTPVWGAGHAPPPRGGAALRWSAEVRTSPPLYGGWAAPLPSREGQQCGRRSVIARVVTFFLRCLQAVPLLLIIILLILKSVLRNARDFGSKRKFHNVDHIG